MIPRRGSRGRERRWPWRLRRARAWRHGHLDWNQRQWFGQWRRMGRWEKDIWGKLDREDCERDVRHWQVLVVLYEQQQMVKIDPKKMRGFSMARVLRAFCSTLEASHSGLKPYAARSLSLSLALNPTQLARSVSLSGLKTLRVRP